jgi:Family of unknown function (DUF5946)
VDAKPAPVSRCAGCGLEIEGGADGCRAILNEMLALHFGNAAYFGAHRLFVDTYAVQHPDSYCVSFKSMAAHLAHLCWSLEHGGSRAVPSEAIRRWVERHPGLEKPPLGRVPYRVTVADVAGTSVAAEHHRAVLRWARATWEAHAELHATVRLWVKWALEEESARRPPRG